MTKKRFSVAFMSKRTHLMDNLMAPSLGKKKTFQSRSTNINAFTRQDTECTKVKA